MVKLKIGTLLKDAFGILKQHPQLFILGIIAAIPSLFMGTKLSWSFIWLGIISFLVSTFCIGLIVRYIYLSREAAPSWPELNSFVVGKYFNLVVTYLIFGAIFIIGSVFLLVPGLLFAVRFCLCDYGILLEGDKIIPSLKRSWTLTKGNWWRLAGLNLIGALPCYISMPLSHVLSKPLFLMVSFTGEMFGFVWLQAIFILVYLELKKGAAS